MRINHFANFNALYKASAVNSILDPNVTLLLVVDSMEGFAALSSEIDDDKCVGLLLDLDVSMGRTGIRDDALFCAC